MKKPIAIIAITLLMGATSIQAQERPGRRSSGLRPGRQVVSSRQEAKSKPAESVVREASHVGPIIEGDVIYEGEVGPSSCSSCDGGGCDTCSTGTISGFCGTCSVPRKFCICFPAHGWVSTEYLLWYQSGMRVPPMVTTTTGTTRATAGVLGQAGTSVLFGDDDYLTEDASGFRIRFGWWLSSLPGWGIEGEYAGLESMQESFFRQSNGTPVLARPFFNALTGAEDAELVAFDSVVRGDIAVDLTSNFDGGAIRMRRQLCCSNGTAFSQLCCTNVPTSSRLDATIGYRFWELDESLQAREQLTSLQTASPGSFDITDRFETRNQFNGAELGFIWQGRRGMWSLDALMRLGIGNVHQTVNIRGSSTVVDNGVSSSFDTGFLAQRTNIGTYDRDKFTMVPELGLTLGYQMTKRIRLTAGYSFIYWGNVVRPGDQVDLDVNPNLLAPEVTPFTGPLRPQFDFVQTDYWVQGLSFGGEFRW